MAAVAKRKRNSFSVGASPVIWGAVLTVGFFALLFGGVTETLLGTETHQFLLRYAGGHPIEYWEVGMFFVAIVALMMKRGQVAAQLSRVGQQLLGPIPAEGQTSADCASLLARLDELPSKQQGDYLTSRLKEGLVHVQQKGGADALDEELKYLNDQDIDRAYGSYALTNVVIWAIPILGFLGTVVGITMAIANLDPASLEESMSEVVAALGVAFDTTALALSLSMVLMFTKFAVEKQETRLLEQVNERAAEELMGRFQDSGTGGDPQVLAVRRMAETMIQASQRLVERQAQLWEESMQRAEERWQEAQSASRNELQAALGAALTDGLITHARVVAEGTEALAQRNHEHWDQVCHALTLAAEASAAERQAQAEQSQMLQRVVDGLGELNRLEHALDRNLGTISNGFNFESTLESLSAVIHLLNARLNHTLPGRAGKHDNELGHAA